jgi:hypothetical protein
VSNEVVPAKELDVPAWLSEMIEAGQQSNASSLVSTVSSVPRISLKGLKFRFIENGEEVRREGDKVHLVILGVQPENNMAKTYYEGEYSGENEPPTCSSWDGIRPDAWVNSKQSDLCVTCKWNKWGSAVSRSGGKAKKCRDSKRLMVVDPRDVENGTIYILNVTVASLKNLSAFGKTLASRNIPMEVVIVTVTMDGQADIPILNFTPAGVMKQEQAMMALARGKKREWNEGQIGQDAETTAALENKGSTDAPWEEPKPNTTPVPVQQKADPVQQQAKPVQTPAKPAVTQQAKPTTQAAPATSGGDDDIESLLSKW